MSERPIVDPQNSCSALLDASGFGQRPNENVSFVRSHALIEVSPDEIKGHMLGEIGLDRHRSWRRRFSLDRLQDIFWKMSLVDGLSVAQCDRMLDDILQFPNI